MPAETERQRRFMGAVRSYKEGRSGGSPEVRRTARSMSSSQVRDFTKKPKRKATRGRRKARRR